VGGILRDVFAMGARPIAILDALRFGPLETGRGRHLFQGVVAGIGGYGNCFGCPTVGGEVYFDAGYSDNPIVNAMCVGLVSHDRLRRGQSRPRRRRRAPGRRQTRDAMASTARPLPRWKWTSGRPSGVPPSRSGTHSSRSCSVKRAFGSTSWKALRHPGPGGGGLDQCASELAHRGRRGIDIDVDRVSRRERGMTAYDVMLSESQERMLVVVRPQAEAAARDVFDHFELHADRIGTVTGTGRIRVRERGALVADLPLKALVDGVPLRMPAALFAEKWTAHQRRRWRTRRPIPCLDLCSQPEPAERARPDSQGGQDKSSKIGPGSRRRATVRGPLLREQGRRHAERNAVDQGFQRQIRDQGTTLADADSVRSR